MKNLIYLIAPLLVISCATLKQKDKGYNGTWILQQQSGGFAGMTIKPDKETKLIIKGDKLKRYIDGKITSEEPFKIEKAKVIHSTEPQDVIVSNKLMKEAIMVKGDTLIILQQCYDCYTFMYVRK
mgnify:CR=1 FL=1